MDVILSKARIKHAALDAALRTQFGGRVAGLSYFDGTLRVHFVDEVVSGQDAETAAGIVAAHDPDVLTDAEQAEANAQAKVADAAGRAANVPGWATISETDALAWIENNLKAPIPVGRTAIQNATTIADFKVILSGILDFQEEQNAAIEVVARLVLALRDARWPHLTD